MEDLVFDDVTGCPPPGRTRLSFEALAQSLVEAPRFARSSTRPILWENLGRYLARFAYLESQYAQQLGDFKLLHCLWLGGSFVSSKIDPRNMDATVIVDGRAKSIIKGQPGAGWLTSAFNREACSSEFAISPIELVYWPIVSVFRPTLLQAHEQDYLIARGGWDDWWQRCRLDAEADEPPSLETVHTRRGYVEVAL